MRSPTIEKLNVSSNPGGCNLIIGTVALSDTSLLDLDVPVSKLPSNNWANTISKIPLNENNTLPLFKRFNFNI